MSAVSAHLILDPLMIFVVDVYVGVLPLVGVGVILDVPLTWEVVVVVFDVLRADLHCFLVSTAGAHFLSS